MNILGKLFGIEGAEQRAERERDQKRFFKAAQRGDLARVSALIEKYPNLPRVRDEDGWAALHRAVDHKDVVELLLAKKADVNAALPDGSTPLHVAVACESEAVVKVLLANKAKVNARNEKGQMPLHDATVGVSLAIVEQLLAAGAEVNAIGGVLGTPLHGAVLNKNKEMVALLVANKADIEAKSEAGATPWELAQADALSEKYEMLAALSHASGRQARLFLDAVLEDAHTTVKGLLEADPRLIGATDDDGRTALHIAVALKHKRICELLLSKGFDPNTGDKTGKTPLHWAATLSLPEFVDLLLTKHADVHARCNRGWTPLEYARVSDDATQAKDQAIRILTSAAASNRGDSGANLRNWIASARPEAWVRAHLNGWNNEDWLCLLASVRDTQFWPMDEAAIGRHLETLRAQLTVQVKETQRPERTVGASLFEVLKDPEGVKMLLEANPGLIFSKDDKDRTPLHSAVISGYKTTAELLLGSGAAANAKDNSGSTPLHYAAINGNKEVVELLLAGGGDVNARAQTGWTPLHWASYKGRKGVAELLLVSGAGVNAREDQVGATPLHWAALEGHKDMVELLLAKGADRLATGKDGQIPLEKTEAKDVVSALIANLDMAAIDRHLEILRAHQAGGAKAARAELLRRRGGHK